MLFPSSLVINQQNLNIDLMKEYSKQWSVDRQQLQIIQMSFSRGSHGQLVTGDFPKNTPTNFSIIRNIVMNVLRREKYINFPQAIRIIGGNIKRLCYLLE